MATKIYQYSQELVAPQSPSAPLIAQGKRMIRIAELTLDDVRNTYRSDAKRANALYHGAKAYIRFSGPITFDTEVFSDVLEGRVDKDAKPTVVKYPPLKRGEPVVATVMGIAALRGENRKAWLFNIFHQAVGEILKDIELFLQQLGEEADQVGDTELIHELEQVENKLINEFYAAGSEEADRSKAQKRDDLEALFEALPEPFVQQLARCIARVKVSLDIDEIGEEQEYTFRPYSGTKERPTSSRPGAQDIYTSQRYVSFYVMNDFRAQAYVLPPRDMLALTQVVVVGDQQDLQILSSAAWDWLDPQDMINKTGVGPDGVQDPAKLQAFAVNFGTGPIPVINAREGLSAQDVMAGMEGAEGSSPIPIKEFSQEGFIMKRIKVPLVQNNKPYVFVEIPLPLVDNPDYTFDTSLLSGKENVEAAAQRILNAVVDDVPLFHREDEDTSEMTAFSWVDFRLRQEGVKENMQQNSNLLLGEAWSGHELGDTEHLVKFPVGWKNLGLAYSSEEVAKRVEQGELPDPAKFKKTVVPGAAKKTVAPTTIPASEVPQELDQRFNEALVALMGSPRYIELLQEDAQKWGTLSLKIGKLHGINFTKACELVNQLLDKWEITSVRAPSVEEIAESSSPAPKPKPAGNPFAKGDFSRAVLERFGQIAGTEEEIYVDLATGESYDTEEEVQQAIIDRLGVDGRLEEYTDDLSKLFIGFFTKLQDEAQVEPQSQDGQVIDFPSYEREEVEEVPEEELPLETFPPEEAEEPYPEEEALPLAASLAQRFASLADRCDQLGLFIEANEIDLFLRKRQSKSS